MSSVASLGSILGVWAHPDDEAYLSAATMAHARRLGQRVHVVTATRGELGNTDPARWTTDDVRELRTLELQMALQILGVSSHEWLDLPDGGLQSIDDRAMVEQLTDIIEAHRPDTILTFGPDGMTGHPDHIAVSRWATEAGTRSGIRVLHAATPLGYLATYGEALEPLGAFQWGTPREVDPLEAAFHIDVTGADLDRKLAALMAQTSQTRPIVDLLGADWYRTWIAAETFVEARVPALA